MTLSHDVLVEELEGFHLESHLPVQENKRYAWVSLLPARPEEMRENFLYVCRLSEAIQVNCEHPGFYYLAIRDRLPDDREREETLSGILIVNENLGLGELFNRVQGRFLQIANWIDQMKAALVSGCDYQELLNLSEPILGNFTSVLDAAYKLLAYTKNIPSDDPINISLLEKGFHTEETMQKFKAAQRFKAYDEEWGIIINPPGNPSRYATVSKWLRYAGNPLIHVIMVCNKRESSPGLVELFGILVEHASICFERDHRHHPSHALVYHGLIMDMLFGRLNNPRVIGERARCINQPMQANFDVYRIVFEENERTPVGRVVEELFGLLPNAKIVFQNYEIIVLNHYATEEVRRDSGSNLERIAPLLEKYSAQCGVSEPFRYFPDLYSAYIQATRAQAIGYRKQMLGNCWNFDPGVWELVKEPDSRIYRYEDILVHYMVHMAHKGTFDVFQRTRFNEAVEQLERYDREHGTNHLQVLYVYLQCERRATAAGDMLRMHRNNVLYRISKIEEMIGIDLESAENRLRIMLAFRYWEIQRANGLELEI